MHKNKLLFAPQSSMKVITFLLLSLTLGKAVANNNELAMQWIQKMSTAMQELSYKGKFVYLQHNQLESMSIIHVKDELGTRERLISLNGEAREILRDNNNLTCVWPSSRQVVVDKSNQFNASPIWVPDDVKRLSRYYDFSMAGKDRIADHDTVIVSIKPKDEFRYGMKVWVNANNGLLLQSMLLDEKGLVKEQIMFTGLSLVQAEDKVNFSILPQIDEGYALIRSHSGQDSKQLKADTQWQLAHIPGGFWIESSFKKKMPKSTAYTQQMVLTDGMASVSIFIEPTSGQSLAGESSMGAVNAYGARIKEFTVTAIGEVPAITVKSLVESTTFQN